MKCVELVIRIGLVALLILVETCAPEDATQLPPEPCSEADENLRNTQRIKRTLRQTADELTDPEVRLIIRAARAALRDMGKDK
jgi:hypothetical protein